MPNRFSRKSVVFFLFLTILLSFWLYRSSFDAYFFQDDWFTFRISDAKNFGDILNFFSPRRDVIYYRPLGMQMPFFILKSLFGINPLPFHLLTFLTHIINIILVFILMRLIIKNDRLAMLSSFFYGTSSVHYIPFFWSATYAFVLGPTAFFLSFIFFLLFFRKREKKYYYFSLFFFILGLLINELTIVLPVILFIYFYFMKKRIEYKSLMPHMLSLTVLLLIRFLMFKPPTSGSYQMVLGRNILSNLKTYILWSFNWSEVMTEQMAHIFIFNAKFMRDFQRYAIISLVTFFISATVFYIIPIICIIIRKNQIDWRMILFGVFWFVIALSPVIFFSHHTFSYYLPIALVGLYISSLTIFDSLASKLVKFNKNYFYPLIFIILINWLLISKTTVDFNSLVHWAPRRARLSENLVSKAKKYYLLNNLDFSLIRVKPSSENMLALNDQDAFKIIFGNHIITIYKDTENKDIL